MEHTILLNLIENESYTRKVFPYLDAEYFSASHEKVLFDLISSYFTRYNELPTREILQTELEDLETVTETDYELVSRFLETEEYVEQNQKWLVEKTEEFCQDRAILNGIRRSIKILEGTDSSSLKGRIPDILKEALSVSFDTSVGHDFVTDYDKRLEYYQKVDEKIEFDISLLNKITGGGVSRKTMNILLAPTGAGKTMFMCHMSAHNLMCGLNVLYITMEMSEEEIGKRIDANLLDIPIGDLKDIKEDEYVEKMKRLKRKAKGRLIIKEYPTASANRNHFANLLQELAIKKDFTPDVIYVDYLNICASSRIRPGDSSGTYTFAKAIAEELRGLAVEHNVALFTATQSNRDAYGSSDLDLQNTSDSIGVPFTADLMLALIATEELTDMGQMMIKQLKNRYNDLNYYRRFVIGVDKPKMRLFNCEEDAQEDVMESVPEERGDFSTGRSRGGDRFSGFV